MAIIFAGTKVSEVEGFNAFPGSSSIAGVADSIAVGGDVTASSRPSFFTKSFAETSEMWFTFYAWARDNYASSSAGYFRIRNTQENIDLFRIRALTSSTFTIEYLSGPNTYTSGTTVIRSTSAFQRYDVHLKIDEVDGIIEVYLEGALVFELVGNTKFTSVDTFDQAYYSGIHDTNSTYSYGVTFAAIIIADEDTRVLKFAQRKPTAVGSIAEWAGSTTGILGAGNDPTQFIDFFEYGNTHTFTAGTNTTIPPSAGCRVIISAAVDKNPKLGNAGIKGVISISGQPLIESDKVIPSSNGLTTVGTILDINPNTGKSFTYAEINSSEFGIKVVE